MAVRPVNIKPKTESQRFYQRFWRAFNGYSAHNESFCAEFKPHPYADVRYYQDYAVSMGSYHLCAGLNFKKQELSVAAYFRDVHAWDIYNSRYKEKIEAQIGRQLKWKRLTTKGEAAIVRHLQLSKSGDWVNVFERIISDLILLKHVFASYYDKTVFMQSMPYSVLDYEEIDNPDELIEGAKKTMIVNRYERDPEARRQCIEAHGCYCHVCKLNFAERYGDLGEGFIHVHHIVPLSSIGQEYVVDPVKDLIPVCPNCHAMLHRQMNGRQLTIQELQEKISKQ